MRAPRPRTRTASPSPFLRVVAAVGAGLLASAGIATISAGAADASTPYRATSLPVSSDGGGVVFAPDGSRAFVTDSSSHAVRVVDTATRTLLATIPVGAFPSGVAITPDGSTVVVANQGGDSISLIDAASDTVRSTIAVGEFPTSVAVTPDGTRALVVDLGDNYDPGDLRVVDLAHGTVVSTTQLGVDPQGIAITPDGARAVVADAGQPGGSTPGMLSVIDTATAHVTASIPVGVTPDAVAIGPDGRTAYATNYTSRTLSVVDLASGTQTATIPVGSAPGGVAVTADGARAYVANGGDEYRDNGSVSIIDTASGRVSSTITVGGSALGIAVSHDGRSIYATNDDATLSAIDTRTMAWSPTTTRLSGSDRYATAAQVAQAAFPGTAPVAFLATGTNFPDALSAAAAAAKLHGPLLLTDPNTLPAVTAQELSALRPGRIVLVGGTSALSSSLQSQVTTLARNWGGTIVREAGADRYATAQLIVADAFPSAHRVFVATGANFPDALSASAAAGAAGIPVVLVNGAATGLDAATTAALQRLGATEFDVAGGTAAVSSGVEDDLATLGTVHRFAGADRYATSALIDSAAFPSPSQAFYVTGATFPDALSGAVLAAVRNAPLAVVQATCVPNATADALADAGTGTVTLIGGPSALGAQLVTQPTCG